MGIKTTRTMSRNDAIYRIKEIATLRDEHNYREIDIRACENEYRVEDFVDSQTCEAYPVPDVTYIENWTNEILARTLDTPFFRHTMFDNYRVENDSEW